MKIGVLTAMNVFAGGLVVAATSGRRPDAIAAQARRHSRQQTWWLKGVAPLRDSNRSREPD